MARGTTLYLRGMPIHLVREAKAAAARRGTTLAMLVADTLERGLRGSGESSAPVDDALTSDMDWYAAQRSVLASRYGGQYIAIVGRKVIDHDRDFGALATRTFERLGTRSVFMPLVETAERRLRVRSPRRASA
jgi:uncharacterized protein DUF5678